MQIFSNPSWIKPDILNKNNYEDFSPGLFEEIKNNINKNIDYSNPKVSVVIAAKDEEVNIVKCIYYLSKNETTFPFEILVVNNNSTDKTQEALDKMEVRSVLQEIAGCGPARSMGIEEAKGKFVLLADADCLYPKSWVETMTKKLDSQDVSCVYGNYSFIGDENNGRFQLWLYEGLRSVVVRLRQFKRPYLNAFGMSMGFPRDLGLKVGVIPHEGRGFDGRLCFDLMQLGQVRWVRDKRAKVWTEPRALTRENNSLGQALLQRIVREIIRFSDYFKKKELHDTKTSKNGETRLYKNVEILKNKMKIK